MQTAKGASIGAIVMGLVFSLLPVLGWAVTPTIQVHCTASTTIAGRLTAAAASPTRTLFVTGVCVENVTVRNQRVIIDGSHSAILIPLDPTKAAITFRGGTTEATIQNFDVAGHIESGANPSPSCNVDGNTIKGGDAIDIREGASVNVISNHIVMAGAGRGIRARNESIVTANANTISGNKKDVTGTEGGAATCGGALNKSFKGSTGIDVSSSAIMALGVESTVTPTTTDNRNTVSGNDAGLNCAQAYLTGIKAPTSVAPSATGGSSITGNTTNLKGFTPYVDPSTQAGYNKLCFTDE